MCCMFFMDMQCRSEGIKLTTWEVKVVLNYRKIFKAVQLSPNTVARLKLKGIGGSALQGVRRAVQLDSTPEISPGATAE